MIKKFRLFKKTEILEFNKGFTLIEFLAVASIVELISNISYCLCTSY